MSASVAVIAAFSLGWVAGPPMTKLECEHVVGHMQMPESWLVDEVSNLSPVQLNFRMAPGRWTILEVVRHLVIAELVYWQQLQAALKRAI